MTIATLGGAAEVETVDGPVTLKIPGGTQSQQVFKLSEHGVPSVQGRRRGDHLATVIVETPSKLTTRQKELLQEFAAEGGGKKGFWKK
jgi:molecular chaperone DnaJ